MSKKAKTLRTRTESLKIGTHYPWERKREPRLRMIKEPRCPWRECQTRACTPGMEHPIDYCDPTYAHCCWYDKDGKEMSCEMDSYLDTERIFYTSEFIIDIVHGDVFHDELFGCFDFFIVDMIDYQQTMFRFIAVFCEKDDACIIPLRHWSTGLLKLIEDDIKDEYDLGIDYHFKPDLSTQDPIWKQKYREFDEAKTIPMLVPLIRQIHPCFTRDISEKVVRLATEL